MRGTKETTLPNFFIIGMPRSATTSFWQYLKKHDEVFMTSEKEPGYYSGRMNFEDYLKLFKDYNGQKIVGDASVDYIASKEAYDRIKKLKCKILIIRRDRKSFIKSYSLLGEKLGISINPNRIYNKMVGFIPRWKALNTLVLEYKDIKRDTEREYKKVLKFLGIRSHSPEFKIYHPSMIVRSRFYFNIRKLFRKFEFMKFVWRKLFPLKVRKFLSEINYKKLNKIH